jgi:hypothetical protein
MDDVFASQVQVEDNVNNRIEHQMVPKDELIISMNLPQAIKRIN